MSKGWALPKEMEDKVGWAIIKATKKALRELGILRAVAPEPPQALQMRDRKEVNMGIVKYILRNNWKLLVADDGSWQGPRGTTPFWLDQEIMRTYDFSQSAESSKYGLTWSPGKTDDDLQRLEGDDSAWITARLEYFVPQPPSAVPVLTVTPVSKATGQRVVPKTVATVVAAAMMNGEAKALENSMALSSDQSMLPVIFFVAVVSCFATIAFIAGVLIWRERRMTKKGEYKLPGPRRNIYLARSSMVAHTYESCGSLKNTDAEKINVPESMCRLLPICKICQPTGVRRTQDRAYRRWVAGSSLIESEEGNSSATGTFTGF